MKIGILTSSRADYGIYLPLLQKMKLDSFFEMEIIAFGTHLSKGHGFTLNDIEKDSYPVIHRITSLVSNDDEQSIVTSYGLTILKFADFWNQNKYDLVFCLGDRYEMSAAVQAGIPFGVKFAHIHGGETTLGAIDNVYRHQITLASLFHFTATNLFSEKVLNLIGEDREDQVFTVGSLSLDEMHSFKPIDKELFFNSYNIPDKEYALITFHPETVSLNENYHYAKVMRRVLGKIAENLLLIITMPNADTLGSIYREEIGILKSEYPEQVILVENFGKKNYFSAMYYAKILIGNTSSGIIEAASFGKYVVNVGDRQKGRVQSKNILNCGFNEIEMYSMINTAVNFDRYTEENVYFKSGAANTIINSIKAFL